MRHPIAVQAQVEVMTTGLHQSWSWYLFSSGPLGLLIIRDNKCHSALCERGETDVIWKKVFIPYQSPTPSSCSFVPLTWSHSTMLLMVGTKGLVKHSSSAVVITTVTVFLDLMFVLPGTFISLVDRWALMLKTSQWKLKGSRGGKKSWSCILKAQKMYSVDDRFFFLKDSPVFSHCAFCKLEQVCIIFRIIADTVVIKKTAYWSQTQLCKVRRIWDSQV